MMRLVDDAMFAARQLELLLYGDYQKRIPVRLFTDSESTLESVASSKQVVNKSLRMMVRELKDKLVDREVLSYAWLPTEHMWADILTKEMKIPEGLEKVLVDNIMVLPKTNINEVKAFDMEVRMENIRNRGGIVQDLSAESRCCFCLVRFGSGSQKRLSSVSGVS